MDPNHQSTLPGMYPTDGTGYWIMYQAPQMDPAWALTEEIKKLPVSKPSERLQAQKDRFFAAIQRFLSDSQGGEFAAAFYGEATWEAVRQAAELAVQEYSRQGQHWNNPFRRATRLVGGMATRLEFLVALVPNGDYLGVLCGGLKLVYTAAKRREELRDLIMGSLSAFETEIKYTRTFIREFASNPELQQRTEDLYIAVLEAIEEILGWIEKQRGFRRRVCEYGKAVIKQEGYGREFETRIQGNVQDKVQAFERAVKACMATQSRDTAVNVVKVGQVVNVINGKVDHLTGDAQKAAAGVDTLEELCQGIKKDMQERDIQLLSRFEYFAEQQKSHLEQLDQQQRSIIRQIRAQQPYQLVIKTPQLLMALQLITQYTAADITVQVGERLGAEQDFVFCMSERLVPRLQARVATLIRDPTFGAWFRGLSSRTLVISGMDSSMLQHTVSPLSYACATLTRSIAGIQNCYPLSFFCRLHSEQSDPLYGPRGVIRSLIAQLVLHLDIEDLPFLAMQDLEVVTTRNLSSLCRLFMGLLQLQQNAMIVCMIDGINFFDRDTCRAELHELMQFLNQAVLGTQARQDGLIFKVLVTSPTACEYFKYWFPDRMEVALSGDFLLGGPVMGTDTIFPMAWQGHPTPMMGGLPSPWQ
ncbi:hypothetical protein BO78DRAFT_419668 [Aspergillus sclerotiicarbonarius CBS 121057]|uniref:Fungal STAND N-terminal Goodbye domain-containing protein n=1 Tax=Aspergillus sclerotiicarbonarius (strain CBS 121057 / IBT 28362) TaxID=1448318 RepID=A0A319E5Q5_ASPSB|nr:hypothetical protein BO78DRAFT_419668 [Aspergillus sclerotiicarbonarius CBS 121057]